MAAHLGLVIRFLGHVDVLRYHKKWCQQLEDGLSISIMQLEPFALVAMCYVH